MKKIIFLITIFIIMFTGCNSSPVKSYNDNNIDKGQKEEKNKEEKKKQEYSFGPAADLSVIDEEVKKEIQDFVNNLGDVPKEIISFNQMQLRYLEDGSLVIDLIIRNGYDYSIYNIDTKLDIIVNEEVVASGEFFFSEEEFGILESNMSRPWSIIYYPEEIKNKEVKLEKYTIKSTSQYEF